MAPVRLWLQQANHDEFGLTIVSETISTMALLTPSHSGSSFALTPGRSVIRRWVLHCFVTIVMNSFSFATS